MKNKIVIIFIIFFVNIPLFAENLNMKSSSISVDKKTKLTILKDNVVVTDDKKNELKTNYAEFDKKLEL